MEEAMKARLDEIYVLIEDLANSGYDEQAQRCIAAAAKKLRAGLDKINAEKPLLKWDDSFGAPIEPTILS